MFLHLSFQLVGVFRCDECWNRSQWFCCMSLIDILFATKLWCCYQSSNGKWVQWSSGCWNCNSTAWRYPGDAWYIIISIYCCVRIVLCLLCRYTVCYKQLHMVWLHFKPLSTKFVSVIINCCIDLTEFTFCLRKVSCLLFFSLSVIPSICVIMRYKKGFSGSTYMPLFLYKTKNL